MTHEECAIEQARVKAYLCNFDTRDVCIFTADMLHNWAVQYRRLFSTISAENPHREELLTATAVIGVELKRLSLNLGANGGKGR